MGDDTKAQIDAEVKEEVKEDAEGKKESEAQAEKENNKETEGKQEIADDNLPAEKEDKIKEAIPDETSDSIINVNQEAVDKQEDETKVKKEEQSEKDQEKDIKESENADSFINDIYETEGKQEQIGELSDDKAEQANYILQVTVVEAADLVNKDKIGKSDPYVVVKFQDEEFRSPTVKNSLSPKWNFISSFKVSSDETDSIHFDVYDDDVLKADEPQGSFSISIPDAFDEDTNTKWFDLKGCKSGKIAVSFVFTEDVEEDQDDEKSVEKEEISPTKEKKELPSEMKEKATPTSDNKDFTPFSEKEVSGKEANETISNQKDVAPIVDDKDAAPSSARVVDKEEAKVDDAFVNDIYEAEGKQAQSRNDVLETNEQENKQTDQDESADDKEQNGVKDSFVNDIYESEYKQEQPSEDLQKELEHKPTEIIKVKSPDEFINVVKESEGKQENENEEKKDDQVTSIKEDEIKDSFMNDIYESEGKQEQTGEIDDKEIEKISYTLKVTVVEASDLVNKDKIGKSDPYVIVKFQDQEFKSSTVKNSLSPKWNFLTSFKVSSDETDSIYFD